jgi:hypothetical protein
MGGAPAVGECRARSDAGCGKPIDHSLQHGVFPAMKMGGAGRVDDKSVRRIGRDDRRVTLECLESEPVEGMATGSEASTFHICSHLPRESIGDLFAFRLQFRHLHGH